MAEIFGWQVATASALSAREVTLIIVSLVTLILVTLVQTGAGFYWAGQIRQMVRGLQAGQGDIVVRLTQVERDGTPLARMVAGAVDKETEYVQDLSQRIENHIAAMGAAITRIEDAERRLGMLETRCDRLHPPAAVTQRIVP